jgi:hypothetical protein
MRTQAPPPSLSDFDPPLPTGIPQPAERPLVVTIAASLLAVQAVATLVDLGVSVAVRDSRGVDEPTIGAIARQLSDGPTSLSPLGVGCAVLFVAICLVLAAAVLRGRNPAARAAALAFSAFGLVCFVAGGISAAPATPLRPEAAWYLDYLGFASLLALVIYASVIVLLAVRPSSRYFAERLA